jgi:predicted  nucleic acid-binding Zn-ribbon protein
MVSTVSSTQSISAVGASNSIAKIAELNKQASTLRQQLLRARRSSGEAEVQSEATPEADKTESLTREIVNVQTQIEQLVLEAQLSRLNVASATKSGNGDAAGSEAGSGNRASKHDAVKGATHGSHAAGQDERVSEAVTEAYQPASDSGKLVDVQA